MPKLDFWNNPIVVSAFRLKYRRSFPTTVTCIWLVALLALGTTAAVLGGAKVGRPTARVVFGGLLAMAATMVIGWILGTATG